MQKTLLVLSAASWIALTGCQSTQSTPKVDPLSSTVDLKAEGKQGTAEKPGDPIPPRPKAHVEYEIKRSDPVFIVE